MLPVRLMSRNAINSLTKSPSLISALKPPLSKYPKYLQFSTIINNHSLRHSSTKPLVMRKQAYSSGNGSQQESNQVPPKSVAYWYFVNAGLVFGIVTIGGLTRLTESGLSITEWNPILGIIPPLSQSDWDSEFSKYQTSPEFIKCNHNITMDEFKSIYYMEWGHRVMGRVIGMTFVFPGLYFAWKGVLGRYKMTSFLVASMIGLQGVLGWLMVRSGLGKEILDDPNAVPRVSHLWLSAHLGSAFVIYSTMLNTGLTILKENNKAMVQKLQPILASCALTKFRTSSKLVTLVIFCTAMSGALVAGLDAGLIYNEFPKMGDGYIPGDMFSMYNGEGSKKHWVWNFLDNPSCVQFDHRVLAMTTAAMVTSLWTYSRFIPLPPQAKLAVNALMGVTIVQVTLGISTLIYMVPIPVAAAHQSGSLSLLSCGIWLVGILKRVR